MKIRGTFVFEWPVDNLDDYGVETIQQAAQKTREQYEDGDWSIESIGEWATEVGATFEGIEE